MAMAANKERCVTCGKEKAVMKCEGCSKSFCYNHVIDHRQELSQQLDEIGVNRDTISTETHSTNSGTKKTFLSRTNRHMGT